MSLNSMYRDSPVLLKSRSYCCSLIILMLIFCISFSYASDTPPHRQDDLNQFLYVLAGQEILAYGISRNGTLTRIPFTSPYLGRRPGFLAASPDGHWLYVGGIDDEYRTPSGYISCFFVSRNGTLSRQQGAPAGEEPSAIAFGNRGKSVYVLSDGFLFSLRISPTGAFTQAAASIRVGRSACFASSPDSHFLLVADNKIITLYRIQTTGALSQRGELRLASQPAQIIWNANGRCVYIASSSQGEVTQVVVKKQKFLTLSSKQVIVGAVHMTFLPGGRYLLVSNAAINRIGTIFLTPYGSFIGAMQWHFCPYPLAMSLSKNGRFLYTLDPKDNLIAQFSVKDNTRPSPLKPAVIQTGNYPLSFAIAGSEQAQ